MHRLAPHGIEPTIVGNGIVIQQIPEPGATVKAGAPCLIKCRPYASMALRPDDETDD